MKAPVHEKCERCGRRAARKVGDKIQMGHRCPKAPPGPSDPPRSLPADAVIFVPGDFTADELRAELDEAWAIIDDLRSKRWQAERRAKAAVETAMRDVYAPREGGE